MNPPSFYFAQVLAEGMNGRMLPAPPYEQSYLIKLISLSEGDGILSTMLSTAIIFIHTYGKEELLSIGQRFCFSFAQISFYS